MSWPTGTLKQVVEQLRIVEALISEISPGTWCHNECPLMLQLVKEVVGVARIVIENAGHREEEKLKEG